MAFLFSMDQLGNSMPRADRTLVGSMPCDLLPLTAFSIPSVGGTVTFVIQGSYDEAPQSSTKAAERDAEAPGVCALADRTSPMCVLRTIGVPGPDAP